MVCGREGFFHKIVDFVVVVWSFLSDYHLNTSCNERIAPIGKIGAVLLSCCDKILFFRICQLLQLPQQQQQQQRSYQPSGGCRRRSDPSSQREPERKRNQRTERQSAYVPEYLSYRRKPGLQPCCPDAEYVLYRRRMQRRSISFQLLRALSCRYQLPDAGNGSGWWSF